MPSDQWLTGPDVQRWLKISRWTLARYRERPDFPDPIQLSNGTYRWSEQSIQDWIDSRPRRSK